MAFIRERGDYHVVKGMQRLGRLYLPASGFPPWFFYSESRAYGIAELREIADALDKLNAGGVL
jgi:hypothetical protein